MRRAEESLLNNSPEKSGDFVLLAPFTGPMVPLAQIPDPVFAEGMFGDGIGIDPLTGELLAPCDGVITHLARTNHAVTIRTPQGAEILVHIGIDTVELAGRGFTPKVEQGASVHAGQVLIEFDADHVAQNAPSLVSVIAVANSDAFEVVERAGQGMLTAGVSRLLVLRAKNGAKADAARSDSNFTEEARRNVTLGHAGGLHARPAARAREAARGFDAKVEVRFNGRKAPVESVVGLLALGAGEGSTIELLGVGPQASAAVDAVAAELLREAHGEVEEKPARAQSPAPVMAARTPGTPLDPNTLAGVCAAPGIAVGKLVRWDQHDIAPPEKANGTTAEESRMLDKAIAAVDAELQETVRTASQRGAVGEAGIFQVHRVLLEDPTLLDAARDLISLGKSAGFGWREAIRAQIAVLSKIEDALLAERAAVLV
jgi:phosphotransferase system HPr (HPr) family protein